MTTVNIMIIGDAGVGKTSYINRLCTGDFEYKYNDTRGITAKNLKVETNIGNITMNLAEFSGQDLYSEIYDEFPIWRDLSACILMFSLTSKQSFRNINKWIRKLERNVRVVPPIILCGAKCDVGGFECISYVDLQPYLQKGMKYYEISSKSLYNLEKPLQEIIRKLFKNETVSVNM